MPPRRDLVSHVPLESSSPRVHWLNATYVEVQRARCLAILGDSNEAAFLYQEVLGQLPPSHQRDRGVYLAREALAHVNNRDPEQAVAVGSRALAIALETLSGRITTELTRLASELSIGKTTTRAAGEFRDQLREQLRVLRRSPQDQVS